MAINKRHVIMGLLLALSVAGFERYFLAPRAEQIRESLGVAFASLKKDEQTVKGTSVSDKDISSASEAMKDLETRLIPEKTEFLASVKLQDEITLMASSSGLRMLTTRPMPSVKNGNYLVLPLYFEGSGNIKQLSEFLKTVESGQLMIKVDKLTVTITNVQNPRELKFKIQVSGVVRA